MKDIKKQIEVDLKTSMLASDASRTTTLRGLKSAILYSEVDQGKKEAGLTDDELTALLQKESKKRQEAADLYAQGGSQERADKELFEKEIIDHYLPAQMSESEVEKIVDEVITSSGAQSVADMGKVIGLVRQKTAAQADGALIARLVKEKLGA